MMSVKKKILLTLLMSGVILCSACTGKTEAESGIAEDGEEASEGISYVMKGSIEVAENLPDRDITVPEYLREENDDSVYHLSGEEQAKMARQVAVEIEDSMNQVLADKDFYPNVTGISVNTECTEFNVTFSGRELSLYENVLPMSLCIVGNRFQLYQGKQESELMTVVNYIDADSGEIFNTINSAEIE